MGLFCRSPSCSGTALGAGGGGNGRGGMPQSTSLPSMPSPSTPRCLGTPSPGGHTEPWALQGWAGRDTGAGGGKPLSLATSSTSTSLISAM